MAKRVEKKADDRGGVPPHVPTVDKVYREWLVRRMNECDHVLKQIDTVQMGLPENHIARLALWTVRTNLTELRSTMQRTITQGFEDEVPFCGSA